MSLMRDSFFSFAEKAEHCMDVQEGWQEGWEYKIMKCFSVSEQPPLLSTTIFLAPFPSFFFNCGKIHII